MEIKKTKQTEAVQNKKIPHKKNSLSTEKEGTIPYLPGLGDVFSRDNLMTRTEPNNDKEIFGKFLENIQEAYFESDIAGNFTFFNNSVCRLLGYSVKDLVGRNYRHCTADRETARKVFLAFNRVYRTEEPLKELIWRITGKDDSERYIEVSVSLKKDSSGKPAGFSGIARDVTGRIRAQEALMASEENYRKIFEGATEGVYQTTPAGRYIIMNPAFAKMFGYASPHEMINSITNISRQIYVNPRDREEVERMLREHNKVEGYEAEVYHKNKTRFWISINIHTVRDAAGNILYFEGTSIDITERRLAQEKFHKVFMTTPDCIVISRMNDGLIIDVNTGFEEITGWKRNDALGKTSYEMNLWNNTADRHFMINELMSGRDVLHREFKFRRSDSSVGTGIYSARTININNEDSLIFILRDMTERKQTDEELQRTLDSLRKAFGTTIQVMISTIEMRDPYTAGHQKRSADVARAIATEMGLDQNIIDGIRIAGTIHDIGKLAIPAEILSKPTRLTNIEFSLIKEHPQVGYAMLKDIESPWPLAEMVYQHHERMDGSGYPRKLKGDEILMEARILAVADVVEAMASHRPYRASLGIEKAVEEIQKYRDILYDKNVVDACLKLFRENGYQITDIFANSTKKNIYKWDSSIKFKT